MINLIDKIHQEHLPHWIKEEELQLRLIEEAAASLVTSEKTHPARKPHLKKLKRAQKDLEIAGEQLTILTSLISFLDSSLELEALPYQGSIKESLTDINLANDMSIQISKLIQF